MDFSEFAKTQVKKPKSTKKKELTSSTPIEEVQERLKQIRAKSGYMDLRKKD